MGQFLVWRHREPIRSLEQITYLLFLRRLDELQTLEENKSLQLSKPIERNIFLQAQMQRAANMKI